MGGPVTMRLSGIVTEIWPFKVFPRNSGRSLVGRRSVGSQYYTDLIILFATLGT